MGIDLLDIQFRFERLFDIDLRQDFRDRLPGIFLSRQPPDLAAGELFQIIQDAIRRQKMVLPDDSWCQFQAGLAQALGVDEALITPDSLLIADLGME